MSWITLTLFYFLIFLNLVARKRLVAPVPWGGEEEAQEEASCSESQLLLHGCKMSRYAFCTHTQVTWGLSFTCERLRGVEFWIIDHCDCFAGCYKITTVFSHAQTVVLCVGCSTVLCQPTGGKARLTEGQYSSTARVSSDGIQWPADINTDCIMLFFLNLFWGVCGRGRNI